MAFPKRGDAPEAAERGHLRKQPLDALSKTISKMGAYSNSSKKATWKCGCDSSRFFRSPAPVLGRAILGVSLQQPLSPRSQPHACHVHFCALNWHAEGAYECTVWEETAAADQDSYQPVVIGYPRYIVTGGSYPVSRDDARVKPSFFHCLRRSVETFLSQLASNVALRRRKPA